jgi:hypothetical protein
MADFYTSPIFALIPADSQKDDWFVDVVLILPPTKNIGMSRQDHNGLIDTGLCFGGDKDSGFVTRVHGIVHRCKYASRISPTISALLEARVLQKIYRIVCLQDTRRRYDAYHKGTKDYYSGNLQFRGYFLRRYSYIISSGQLVKS